MEPKELAVIDYILEQVKLERRAQYSTWGRQMQSLDGWTTILGEEYGEVCRAIIDRDRISTRLELVQLAAVAVQIIEAIDRGEDV